MSDDPAFGAVDIFTVDANVVVRPGDRAILAVDGSAAANGGVTVDYDCPGAGVNLNNGADDLYLGIAAGRGYTTLDGVAYDEKRGWPIAKGVSIELNDGRISPSENDAASAWCLSTSAAGSTTDRGSPGPVSSGW